MPKAPILAMLAGALSLLPDLATADIRPSPEQQKATLAGMIKDHKHPCPSVTSFDDLTGDLGDELRKKGHNRTYAVTCSNGRRYAVAYARSRPGPPRPDAPPLPKPVVQPLR